MSATAIGEWVLSGGLLVGIGYTCVRSLASEGRRGRLRLLALRRAPRARRAAEEAALGDPAFAPEHIEAAVRKMLPRVLGDPLAAPLLSSPLAAAPEDDASRLQEASLEELTEPRPRADSTSVS